MTLRLMCMKEQALEEQNIISLFQTGEKMVVISVPRLMVPISASLLYIGVKFVGWKQAAVKVVERQSCQSEHMRQRHCQGTEFITTIVLRYELRCIIYQNIKHTFRLTYYLQTVIKYRQAVITGSQKNSGKLALRKGLFVITKHISEKTLKTALYNHKNK